MNEVTWFILALITVVLFACKDKPHERSHGYQPRTSVTGLPPKITVKEKKDED